MLYSIESKRINTKKSSWYQSLPSKTLISHITKFVMATERQISTFEVTSIPETMPMMNNHGGAENPSLLITSHKFNRHNFLQWSQLVMMYVCGKGKMNISPVK